MQSHAGRGRRVRQLLDVLRQIVLGRLGCEDRVGIGPREAPEEVEGGVLGEAVTHEHDRLVPWIRGQGVDQRAQRLQDTADAWCLFARVAQRLDERRPAPGLAAAASRSAEDPGGEFALALLVLRGEIGKTSRIGEARLHALLQDRAVAGEVVQQAQASVEHSQSDLVVGHEAFVQEALRGAPRRGETLGRRGAVLVEQDEPARRLFLGGGCRSLAGRPLRRFGGRGRGRRPGVPILEGADRSDAAVHHENEIVRTQAFDRPALAVGDVRLDEDHLDGGALAESRALGGAGDRSLLVSRRSRQANACAQRKDEHER